MAFEIDEIDESGHSGWSVVVRGPAASERPRTVEEEIDDEDLGITPWVGAPKTRWLRIAPALGSPGAGSRRIRSPAPLSGRLPDYDLYPGPMRMGPHISAIPAPIRTDRERPSVGRRTLRRVWELAHPYRAMLFGFLATIVLAALLALVPPLIIRAILDDAIPEGDRHMVTVLAGLMAAAAFAEAVLSLGERWWSSRIGEGLIYDMRSRLFDHVQRMPVSFFTRTQTGALVTRLNNDVIGAQRALTRTLGSVVSNLIVLATTLVAMLALEWRLTLVALVLLPIFIIPAKRVGRQLQDLTREGMNLNASMNTTMTERFGVSGAMLVKLFGRYDTETSEFSDRAGRVRDIGVRTAMVSRVFFIALGLVASIGTATIYWLGGQLVISETITLGTLVALGAYVVRIYTPLTGLTNARVDLMTAFVSFDRVFEVLDTPNPIEDRTGAVDLIEPRGRVELDGVSFRYPAARWCRRVARGPGGCDRRHPRDVPGDGAARHHRDHRAGRARRPGRAVGRRQDHAQLPGPAFVRRHRRGGARRRSRRPGPHPGLAPIRHRGGEPGPAPLPRDGRREPAVRPTRRHRRRGRGRLPPRRSTTSSPPCPTGTTPSSVSGGTDSPAARSSASPSPGCS